MNRKPDWGWAFAGAMMILLGILNLWQYRSAVLYGTPIVNRGWMYPWQAFLGGSLCLVFGFFLILRAIFRGKKTGGDS